MEVDGAKFKRWVVEMPDRMSFNPKPSSSLSKEIFKCTPLRRGMLEMKALAILASLQAIDRCRSRFMIASRR